VGYLRVVTRGGSARVRVDGRRYGFTPQLLKVDGGRHIVTVEGAGDAVLPSQLTVDVKSDDTTSAVFSAPGASRPRTDSVTPPPAPTVPQVTPDSAATPRR
jgi:hypothetical protein